MRIVGFNDVSGHRMVAVREADSIVPIAPIAEFWADPHGCLKRREKGPPLTGDLQLTHPVPAGARILCLGLNYRAHADEGAFDAPTYPMIFGRWTASLVTSGTAVGIPPDEPGLDWEAEIAAVIGRQLSCVDAATARAGIFGYAAFNDITARRAQKLTAQWTLGKNADNSGPLGDLVTADEVGDLRDGLQIRTRVNGETMQNGNSRDMIFEVGEVIALISRTMTLNPGDIIATGTPEGVGYVRDPPVLLHDGDVVEVDIEKLGLLVTPVVARLDDREGYSTG